MYVLPRVASRRPQDSRTCTDDSLPPSEDARSTAAVLLAATVDPRLAEPLKLLAEVGARDTTDGWGGRLQQFRQASSLSRADLAEKYFATYEDMGAAGDREAIG